MHAGCPGIFWIRVKILGKAKKQKSRPAPVWCNKLSGKPKNKKPKSRPMPPVQGHGSGFFCFFGSLVLPCVFGHLGENRKPWENKETKQQKIQTHVPAWGAWVWIFCFFVFWFPEGFLHHTGAQVWIFWFPGILTLIQKSPGKRHAV